MEYYISKIMPKTGIAQAEAVVVEKLKEQGFGIITEIDVAATLKNKIDVDFRPYKILGACNPQFAHKALQKSDKMGVMLPCNVCLQQHGEHDVEIFAINPLVAMQAINSPEVEELAKAVYSSLKTVIDSL